MNEKLKWFLIFVCLLSILAACSGGADQPTEGEQPLTAETAATTADPAATADPATLPTAPPAATAATPGNLRPIPVDGVQIEIGVGSPIPVDIFVSGSWPDLCAQIAQINQRMNGNQIEIELMASAADPNCPPDFLGLPFRIAIPVNTVQMAEGSYPVVVNGVTAAAPLTIPLVQPPVGELTPEAGADLAAFEAQVQQVVLERNFGQMPALMADPFTIAGWRSEGASYAPPAAVEQLQLNFIGQGTPLAFQPLPEAMVGEFQGMFGPDVNVEKMLYATGWGLQGSDEALLYLVRRPDGALTWHSVLVATGGFGEPVQPPPAGNALPSDVGLVMAQVDVPIYDGPGNNFATIGQVFAGQMAAVTGVSPDGLWWQVVCPVGSAGSCWVSADPALTLPSLPPGG
jgi:hypothetical protein